MELEYIKLLKQLPKSTQKPKKIQKKVAETAEIPKQLPNQTQKPVKSKFVCKFIFQLY